MKRVIPFVVCAALFTGCIKEQPQPDTSYEQTDVTETTVVSAAALPETTVTTIKFDPIFLTETTTTAYVPIDISLGYSGDVDMVVLYGGSTYKYVKTVDPDDSEGLTFAGIITKCEASPEGNYSSNFAPVGSSVYKDGDSGIIIKISPGCACLCECPAAETEAVTDTDMTQTEAETESEEETTVSTDELIADDGIYEIVPVTETAADTEA